MRTPSGSGELKAIKQEHSPEDDFDSMAGCTAVVAYIDEGMLYVANSGDSRCVLGRAGTAVDMSYDHKPENAGELARITAAGGSVIDGRVNGNLNLSRSLGDFEYKQNPSLPPEDQMITANPDIKTI
jgi:serine/threonine protein phosphatase PrpC